VYNRSKKTKEKGGGMSFQDDVKLDVTTLDTAALEQPAAYAEWGNEWAKAVLERDRLKERLSAKKAEIDDRIRKEPSEFGWTLEKSPTETWIANQVVAHADVMALTEELLQAQFEVNHMTVAKEAMDHRLKALSILTELYKGNYYSATSKSKLPRERAIEASQDRQREKLEKSMKLKRRTEK
jgi:hypothetical protein